ncbi:MAG: hypothetical protein LBP59_16485 [Planctomycetaceae bacterium]|nr:hypothetical protein [Planctomycetaceae bacterium]
MSTTACRRDACDPSKDFLTIIVSFYLKNSFYLKIFCYTVLYLKII